MKKITTKEFKDRAFLIHGNKFIYDKVDLEHRDEKGKILIICPIHGEFWQTPHAHLNGQGCPKCSHKSTKYTVEEIKDNILKKYNGKYDVSLIKEYKSNTQKLPLVCDEHGYFEATWNDLSNNHGCQKCGKIHNHLSTRKTKDKFISECSEIHGDRYDYSLVSYVSANTHILIKCNKCGYVFKMTPNEHLKGKGCPRCNESHLENEVRLILSKNNIEFLDRKRFEWLGRQHLDFYLPKYNIAIECQGGQHFRAVKHFGGLEGFKKRHLLDIRKKTLCENHNIKIVYFTHENDETFLGEKVVKDINELLNKI